MMSGTMSEGMPFGLAVLGIKVLLPRGAPSSHNGTAGVRVAQRRDIDGDSRGAGRNRG